MGVFNVSGVPVSASDDVLVTEIRGANPSYTDDQLLAAAITAAQAKGERSKIVWDGEDIHFSGQTTHICKGFGGIDFGGSKIYMPNYDNGIIMQIVPTSAEDVTVAASDVFSTYTTDNRLKGKVAQLNANVDGNATMCLGDRLPFASYGNAMYVSPTIKITSDGYYATGKLFMPPSSGDVVCYNVHDFPRESFEVKNAHVISYASNKMSTLISCYRSNTHVHHFEFSGRSTINSFHNGPFSFNGCSDIEVDHLYGVNPVQQSLTSGYIFSMNRVSCAHVHDVAIGDRTGWGAVGCGNLTNTVWERCYLDRWDCHYAQYGYNVVRDCVINHVNYGIGNGSLIVENCIILNNKDSSNTTLWFCSLRSDIVGVFDGDIIIRNCDFLPGKQNSNKTGILLDSCQYAKPANSAFSQAPKRNRLIENCRFPDETKYVFQTGTETTADQPMFANLTYNVEDTIVGSGTTIITALGGKSVTDANVTNYHKKIT